MNKQIKIKIIGEAEEEFEKLNESIRMEKEKGIENSQNQQLMRSIERNIEMLKNDPSHGIQIPRKLIPKYLPVDNLWKVNLTGYWRMLYTLKGGELEVICFILEITNHKKYDKIFNYSSK